MPMAPWSGTFLADYCSVTNERHLMYRIAALSIYLLAISACSKSSEKTNAHQPVQPQVNNQPMPATDFSSQSRIPSNGQNGFGSPQTNPSIPQPSFSSPNTNPSSQDQCYKATPTICDTERLITQLTNQIRQIRSKSALVHDERLSFIARAWSYEQARVRDISHDGFPESRVAQFRQEFVGIRVPAFSAENVAMTYVGRSANPGSVAQEFVEMWRTSIGHLLNMLGNHRSIGVGIAQAADGSLYATQIFGN
jgi:uncharacterized protein YkwD